MKHLWIYIINMMMLLIMVIIMSMMSVAFFTLLERKIMSLFHYRKGPNKISFIGILQPFSDAMKLLSKEFFYPYKINMYMYMYSPMILLMLSFMMWMLYPMHSNLMKLNYYIILFISLVSMSVYGLILSGWSSNSYFPLLGSMRSIAQSISYEVTFSISLLIITLLLNSMNLIKYNNFNKNLFFLMNLPLMMLMFLSMLAEVNRTPFDLSESESELISGFNIEYSSSNFTLIFLAEYSSMMFMMMLFNLIFFNFNLMNMLFFWMTIMMIYLITWIRMTMPRLRYDKLMYLCWIYLLPLSLYMFIMYLILYKLFYDYQILIN